MAKKIYKNKNGNMSTKDFISLIHNDKLDGYMRKFTTLKDKCPPYELIDDSISCFYCVPCARHCESRVKIYKNHYSVGKVKFEKSEFDKGEW